MRILRDNSIMWIAVIMGLIIMFNPLGILTSIQNGMNSSTIAAGIHVTKETTSNINAYQQGSETPAIRTTGLKDSYESDTTSTGAEKQDDKTWLVIIYFLIIGAVIYYFGKKYKSKKSVDDFMRRRKEELKAPIMKSGSPKIILEIKTKTRRTKRKK